MSRGGSIRTGATEQGWSLALVAIGAAAVAPAILASGSAWTVVLAEGLREALRICFASFVHLDVVLHGLPRLLLAAGIAWAILRRIRRALLMRRALLWCRPPEEGLEGTLHRIADRHGATDRLALLPGQVRGRAFTAGLWRPWVFLSRDLAAELTESELEALVVHELHHCRRRDPLRVLAITFLADVLFWVPMAGLLARRLLAAMEFAADDAARRWVGDRDLSRAILAAARLGRGARHPSPAFSDGRLVHLRILRLTGDCPKGSCWPKADRRSVRASVAVIILFWVVGLASSGTHLIHLAEPAPVASCAHEHEILLVHAGSVCEDTEGDPGHRPGDGPR